MNIIEEINSDIEDARAGGQPVGNISDGYHTFEELYKHRHALFLNWALLIHEKKELRDLATRVWRTREHHPDNEPMFEDMFLMGVELPSGSIQYHLPLEYWDTAGFAFTIKNGPYYDGVDNPDNVLLRFEQTLGHAG